jgi:ubiquinone/menaquinone biosynthesis C-methylase UbiE
MPLFRRTRPLNAGTLPDAQGRFPWFTWLGGRRLYNRVPYVLPKDMSEVNRLDFQHYLLRQALRGNYSAPIQAPQTILDVATGTGRWTIEMAQVFPDARVYGVDLVVPEHASLPANVSFQQANVLQELPFPSRSMSFVHQRLVYGAIPLSSWEPLIRDLARVTAPGGWVELVEGGLPQGEGGGMRTLVAWVQAMASKRGIDLEIGPRLGTWMNLAGLQDVTTREIRVPLGPHGGRVGQLCATDAFGVYEALKAPVVAAGIASAEDYDKAMDAWHFEVRNEQQWWPVYLAYGQRPGSGAH